MGRIKNGKGEAIYKPQVQRPKERSFWKKNNPQRPSEVKCEFLKSLWVENQNVIKC